MIKKTLLTHAVVALTVVAFYPVDVDAQSRTRGARSSNAPPPSAAALQQKAEAALASRSVTCGIAGSRWISYANMPTPQTRDLPVAQRENEQVEIFEVACQTGPGYVIADGERSGATLYNCLALNAAAPQEQQGGSRAQRTAQVDLRCELPQNTDVTRVVQGYVQAANLDCQVDQAVWLSSLVDGNERYEVSCAGRTGYWIEAAVDSTSPARVVDCFENLPQGATCQFTTPERVTGNISRLIAEAPRTCEVSNGRFAGANDRGRFYEAACAEGSGFMFLFAEGRVQEQWDCVDAQRIGGGCTLTPPAVIQASATERLTRVGLSCSYQGHNLIGNDSRGRQVVEYRCSDRPGGLVAFIGADAASSEGMTCEQAAPSGVRCTLQD
ncbi:MAG: hypothetical protein ACK4E3_04925 [Brevundimonas sp.]|uniref:hypothetical protein n=1 Tax=Brevundimonas sp. TaxID=1871086 RepID=UPI003918E9D9